MTHIVGHLKANSSRGRDPIHNLHPQAVILPCAYHPSIFQHLPSNDFLADLGRDSHSPDAGRSHAHYAEFGVGEVVVKEVVFVESEVRIGGEPYRGVKVQNGVMCQFDLVPYNLVRSAKSHVYKAIKKAYAYIAPRTPPNILHNA